MTEENPYAPPAAHVADLTPEIPDDVRKKIRNAWIAAVVSGSVTLIFTLVAISGTVILGFSAWMFLDVALIFGLALGIYKKSRTCAVIMLIYFAVSKIVIMLESATPAGIFTAIIFFYFYWQGVSGTFAYHRIKNQKSTLTANGA